MWLVPSATFLTALRPQVPEPKLFKKLRRGFPFLGQGTTVEELAVFPGYFPHHLDCGDFVTGSTGLRLARRPLSEIQQIADEQGFTWSAGKGGTRGKLASVGDPVIAVFCKDSHAQHFALSHVGETARIPGRWASKFGRRFPVLEHDLDDLRDGDYGDLTGFFCGTSERCGTPDFEELERRAAIAEGESPSANFDDF